MTKKKKIGPARNPRVELERRAFELSKRCPAAQSNPGECPLFGLRPMLARERRAWIHQLSDDELVYLVAYHRACFAEKIAAARTAKRLGRRCAKL